MPRVEVALAVTVHSALASSAGARDARGRLLLPASQVKGRLRHACEQVARGLGLPVCSPPNPATMCSPGGVQGSAPAGGVGVSLSASSPSLQPRGAGEASPCVVCALFGAPAWPSPLRWRDLRTDGAARGARAD